jgi:deoxyribodipyrimidine photolyase-like uncharacterized protein
MIEMAYHNEGLISKPFSSTTDEWIKKMNTYTNTCIYICIHIYKMKYSAIKK